MVPVDAEADTGWEKGATIQLKKIVYERLAGKVDNKFVVRTGSAADEVLNATEIWVGPNCNSHPRTRGSEAFGFGECGRRRDSASRAFWC